MNRYFALFVMVLSLLASCSIEQKPNFLFAIADDASYPHMGAYGCDWVKTPAFDKVASEGILFGNAYTPNAKCAPSRACILTGRNSWQLEEAANHWPYFPAKFKTFAEVLHENGYHVGYTLKGYAPGIALNADGSKRDLLVKAFNKQQLEPPTNGIAKNDYSANFEQFLEARQEGEPFFFWYGSIEPHRAYEYNSGALLAGKTPEMIDKVPGFWPDSDTVRRDMLDYAFEIEYFDSHLARMLETLENIGELENTIIIVTADNGMPFPRVKGQAYEYSNHLPLAMSWPAGIKKPGRRVNDVVSFIDFAPTFLELANIDQEVSGMQAITGKSLTDIFFSNKSELVTDYRDHVLIGKERHDIGRPDDQCYPIRGIMKDGMLYIRNFKPDRWPGGDPVTGYLNCDGSPTKTQILNLNRSNSDIKPWELSFGKRVDEELYDISKDPECIVNLALNGEYQDLKKELASQLETELKDQKDPRIHGNGDVFDKYTYANKKHRNYYNRFISGEIIDAGWVNKTDYESK